MSKSYLTHYEMMHIPCSKNLEDHHKAEQGKCTMNVDGVCISGGISVAGKCHTGLVSTPGKGYHNPKDPSASSGPYTVFYANNIKYAGNGGHTSGTNAHWTKPLRLSFL